MGMAGNGTAQWKQIAHTDADGILITEEINRCVLVFYRPAPLEFSASCITKQKLHSSLFPAFPFFSLWNSRILCLNIQQQSRNCIARQDNQLTRWDSVDFKTLPVFQYCNQCLWCYRFLSPPRCVKDLLIHASWAPTNKTFAVQRTFIELIPQIFFFFLVVISAGVEWTALSIVLNDTEFCFRCDWDTTVHPSFSKSTHKTTTPIVIWCII